MTHKNNANLLAAGAAATTILVWAASFPAIHLALREISPLPLAAARYAVASVFALTYLLIRRPRLSIPDLLVCGLCAGLSAVGYSTLLNLGQETVSAGAASFLVKTESLWMALLATLFLKERFGAWGWAGTLLALMGVLLIASAQPGGLTFGAGAVFVLVAALCSSTGFVLQRGPVARHGALPVAACILLAAGLVLLPWLPSAASELGDASPKTWAWVLFLGLLPTTVGLVCWTYALGHFGAARAGNLLYLVAPLATFLSWVMTGEAPKLSTIAGGSLVIAGVLLVNGRGQKRSVSTDT